MIYDAEGHEHFKRFDCEKGANSVAGNRESRMTDITCIRFYAPEIDYEGNGIVNAIGADFEVVSSGNRWKGHAHQDLANMESVGVEWDGDGPPDSEYLANIVSHVFETSVVIAVQCLVDADTIAEAIREADFEREESVMDIAAFTIRRVGTTGCEIIDPEGQVIGWTTTEPWHS